MNTGTKAFAYAAAGVTLAGIVVFSGMTLGLLSPVSTGTISIMLTDPPSVPYGVSAVYLSYTGFALHPEGMGAGSWVTVGGTGTLDTLGLVNISQTISSAKVPSLRYNLITFAVTSASVDFNGQNYSATINGGRVFAPIPGGLTINSSRASAAIVDVQLNVLNVGNQNSPEFVVAMGARALQVPSDEVTQHTGDAGYRLGLSDHQWYQNFESNRSNQLSVSGVALSSQSLSFTLLNQGPSTLNFRMVALVKPGITLGAGKTDDSSGKALNSILSSALFNVGQDGSLTLIPQTLNPNGTYGGIRSALNSQGYNLNPGSSFTFTFSGGITSSTLGGIVSGQTYYLVLLGPGIISTTSVVSA